MSALAAAVLLAVAAGGPPAPEPLPAATPAAATSPGPASPDRAADAAQSLASAGKASPELTLPRSSGPGFGSLAAPAALLLGLGGLALVLARRKGRPSRIVQVLETTALGPRRSLVLARLGDELLLLGASEAGITLLRSQPAEPDAAPLSLPQPGEQARAQPAARRPDAPPALAGLVSRLRGVRPAPAGFDAILTESVEDQELRRKLARGQAGSVR